MEKFTVYGSQEKEQGRKTCEGFKSHKPFNSRQGLQRVDRLLPRFYDAHFRDVRYT